MKYLEAEVGHPLDNCKMPRIKQNGLGSERPMSSSRRERLMDDDDDDDTTYDKKIQILTTMSITEVFQMQQDRNLKFVMMSQSIRSVLSKLFLILQLYTLEYLIYQFFWNL